MEDREAREMMSRCAEEITSLRRQIDQLKPKAEAYESVQQILRLLPQPSQGYSEDLVWQLRKRIEKIDKDNVNTSPA